MKTTKEEKPILIGLTGLKRAGKDSVAAAIERLYGNQRVLKISFAKPIREFVARVMGVTGNQLEKSKDAAFTIPGTRVTFSPRRAMQTLGTEWGRDLDENLWVAVCERWISQIEYEGTYLADYILVTDVRFDNEAEMIQRRGGYVVRVDRPDQVGDCSDGHASERGVSDRLVDIVLQNDGGLDDLSHRVTNALMPYIKRLHNLDAIRALLRDSFAVNQHCFINPMSERLAA